MKYTSLSIYLTLSLAGNNMTGTIPPGLARLDRLAGIYLFNNHFSGIYGICSVCGVGVYILCMMQTLW